MKAKQKSNSPSYYPTTKTAFHNLEGRFYTYSLSWHPVCNIQGVITKQLTVTSHPIMTLTLGDIRPQWGQGLVFSRRTRTATCAASISRNHTVTSPGDRASYDARIYDFEPDVWGGTRLLTLSGPGLNRGIRLAWAK